MACTALSAALHGKVFYPTNVEYQESTTSYCTVFENELKPSCIVRPQCAEDVSTILKILKPLALAGDVKIAIRGGGHTPWAGAANIQGGVTVDMQNITGVSLDPQKKIARIGSGERWANVYSVLGQHGLAVAGGRVSKVGVGGLTAGGSFPAVHFPNSHDSICSQIYDPGGLSYHSSARGFVCDNVINYEIALASGEIVEANAQSYPDLFHALKGGNNNFGVITRFDMQTFQQGQMLGGLISYNSSAFPDVAKAFIDFAFDPNPDPDAHVIAAASFVQGMEAAVANIYHAKPSPNPPSLEPFIKIQPQLASTLRDDSLLGFTEEQSAFTPNVIRSWFFTTTWHADLEFMKDVRALGAEAAKSLSTVPGFILALAFQPLTKGLLTTSAAAGGNSLGLTPEDGPLVVNLLQTLHAEAVDDEKVKTSMLGLIKSIEDLAAKKGKSSRYKFTNYSYKTQDPIAGYGPESVSTLRAVSKKYDPHGFFQKSVPGGYKIPTS